MRRYRIVFSGIIGLGCAAVHATPITALNTGSGSRSDSGSGNQVMETTPQTISFDAGVTADALIVILSSESDAGAGQVQIRYDGLALSPVIDHSGGTPSIWLLNLGGTSYSGGAANLVLDMTGVNVVNGYGLGVVSVNTGGLDLGVHDTNSAVGSKSIGLSTTETTFVVAGHRSNSSSGSAPPNGPLIEIYAAQIGSSQGGAGYEESVAAGNPTYSFGGITSGAVSSAAAFVAVPEPSTLMFLALGGLAFARRFNRS